MAVITSGSFGVNIGNLGGWAEYLIQDTGKITVVFTDGGMINWSGSGLHDGILAVYNGKEYEIPYTSSSSGKTVSFNYNRDITEIELWGMGNGHKAGEVSLMNVPTDNNLADDPIGVTVYWDVPNTSPTATISATTPTAGAPVTVSWKFSDADGDSVSLVRLVRYYKAPNKTSYSGTTILSGSVGSSYKDNIPETYGGGSMYYEILFEDEYGGSGTAKTTAATVVTNKAPTTPGIPKLPYVINAGESITITWDASSDADGNLEGYKLERSVDNGTTWEQIYQGSGLSVYTKIPEGISTVMYRVKAYDSYGAESAYAETPVYTVTTNAAPTAPSLVSIPAEIIRGSTVTVSWTSASDPEGDNLRITYEVQRSVNNAAFTTVDTTQNRTFQDTVGSAWDTVQYRVRAIDYYGAKSEYRESIVSSAVLAIRPTIQMNSPANGSDYGIAAEPFSIMFTVKNKDSQPAVVKVYIDGVYVDEIAEPVRGGETKGYLYLFNGPRAPFWYKIPNGKHTMAVRAIVTRDDVEVYSEASFTFTKLVDDAVITLDEPMTASEKISVCVISVNGSIPEDAQMTVEVTNNGNDDSPVWEDATHQAATGMNHVFSNAVQSRGWAFNFRVTVHGGDTRGYITSIQGGFQ